MNNLKLTKRLFTALLTCVLIAATALLASCGVQPSGDLSSSSSAVSSATITPTEVGEGKTEFTLTVTDGEGNDKVYLVHTDKESVGDALLELKLIEGEVGPYGLYITSVCGITADYDVDGSYWAFYVDGEYAMTGVSDTAISDGGSYQLKVEK